ncbi:blr8049 [Bradyrhizobium diazoefficiens USDA 110]|uniref:Blr8049 protein n=1 Tax=Bradyrhizobium diazoefficiens (strain JCM 10833 / BCRC 13528 / IAM 13628 / NBRC 14792 / USDA 110) TaxID=224911 RepID=Q89BU9_BRADU|nr:hypothetical protein Bdiaspc4_42605 [Bradyrhizobium diazoefficiens]BAC53314.1 blr8049 [Bradyrhizobium diazoefficiens USDA 110]
MTRMPALNENVAGFRHRVDLFVHHQEHLFRCAFPGRDKLQAHVDDLHGVHHQRQGGIPEKHFRTPGPDVEPIGHMSLTKHTANRLFLSQAWHSGTAFLGASSERPSRHVAIIRNDTCRSPLSDGGKRGVIIESRPIHEQGGGMSSPGGTGRKRSGQERLASAR